MVFACNADYQQNVSMKFCVEYSDLNDVTKKNSYPFPRIDDTLTTLSAATDKLIYIQKTRKEKTMFSTGRGLY